jgi:SRSO17 transposase
MILSKDYYLEEPSMDYRQIASLQPALARLLETFRPCFKRDKTFDYWQKYILGLMSDLKRKSIEPIALACGVAVRTLQEFLAFFQWDHEQADRTLIQLVVNEQHGRDSIGILDASAHSKQGTKTPGVQRQWCGETGKKDNCVVGQHLLYTDNDPTNPFTCVVASDLFLSQSWDADRARCRAAGIPDELAYRAKWRIGIDQIEHVMAQGLRFDYVTFDEDYGKVPAFIFELDRLGQKAIGEVPSNFRAWTKPPCCQSFRGEHASRRVDNLVTYSPVFYSHKWQTVTIKDTTRGKAVWQVKTAQVHLVAHKNDKKHCPVPTERTYWLIVAKNPQNGKTKYFVSNAPVNASLKRLLEIAFCRWHIEKWFERGKQECGFGAFEVRTYTSLIRHWLSARLAMYFLARQTQRLRGEKSTDHSGAGFGYSEYVGMESMGQESSLMERQSLSIPILSRT